MKRPADERLVAMQFEHVIQSGGGRSPQLYAIEGVPGVYRKVAKTPASERPEDHLLAYFGSSEVQLTRAKDVEEELRQAGFLRAKPNVDNLRPAEKRAVLNNLFDEGDGGPGPEDGGCDPQEAEPEPEPDPDDNGLRGVRGDDDDEPDEPSDTEGRPASSPAAIPALTPEARERAMRGAEAAGA